ncbi:hydroxyethylthiazole kinase [Desulfospira joergensenii]|uniref:hydroxyethylthiazole kinase n=1 Tax=Desulfospira joergensenii TaxID=53329 RepID=UPI0003B3688F|nr:hydroxyethylthiazole kinase [Desulfospira joergensenii]
MTIQPSAIWQDMEKIRQTAPLVHNITNFVVMNNTANALLALGASPVMAHAGPEVEDMVGLAGALVINIGTLSDPWIDSMFKAGKKAKERGIPIVLDPVGAGATPYRTRTALGLIRECIPAVIRGNGSEIMALCREEAATKGVDSTSGSDAAVSPARSLSLDLDCTVCVTGKTDYIITGSETLTIKNGHAMMPRVTGLGCTATALCGAFAAVNPNFGRASAHAMAVMGMAGEMAAETARGPGSLQVNFIDALYNISETDIENRLKIDELGV